MGLSLDQDESRTPWPRSKEDTHPDHISWKRNVETPMRSGLRGIVSLVIQYADRKESRIPQWEQETQEANAGKRIGQYPT